MGTRAPIVQATAMIPQPRAEPARIDLEAAVGTTCAERSSATGARRSWIISAVRSRSAVACCCVLLLSVIACGEDSHVAREARVSRGLPSGPTPLGMIAVAGGRVHVGSDTGTALERPVIEVEIAPFFLDADEVTVERFAQFVAATGWITSAERDGSGSVMRAEDGAWELLEGAHWRAPFGPGSTPALPSHPVTQVSWDDASTFCVWSGGRLPTELEWEHAARHARDAREDESFASEGPSGAWRANVWQGAFPESNTVEDGYATHAPVGSFPRSELGLSDMMGNVWEWTSSWLRPHDEHQHAFVPGPGSQRVLRGGSFLCARDVCHGHRASARIGATPESALVHVGVRCARDGA